MRRRDTYPRARRRMTLSASESSAPYSRSDCVSSIGLPPSHRAGCRPWTLKLGPHLVTFLAAATCATAQPAADARAIFDRAVADFQDGRLEESAAGFRSGRRVGTRLCTPTVAARDRAVLCRPLPRLPRAVRVAPHCQPQRRRERCLAFPLRRPSRDTGAGPSCAPIGWPRPPRAHARGLRDVPGYPRRGCGAGRRG